MQLTAAMSIKYVSLTDANAGSVFDQLFREYPQRDMLVVATHKKCVGAGIDPCSQTSRNMVPQRMLSWNMAHQLWVDNGAGTPGDPGSIARTPILANGAVDIAHFAHDDNDYFIPASFMGDLVTGVERPFDQDIKLWKLHKEGSAGFGATPEWNYRVAQTIATGVMGTRCILPFRVNTAPNSEAEQFLLVTQSVNRNMTSPNDVAYEQYEGLNQDIYRFDSASSQFLYSSTLTTSASGVVHAHYFELLGQSFMGLSNFIGPCPTNSSSPSSGNCVERPSHIYKLVASGSSSPKWSLHAALATNGARAMHYFAVSTPGASYHFLAVAEHRHDDLEPSHCSVYRIDGDSFSLFQLIEGLNYAVAVTSYVEAGQTVLAFTERGVPIITDGLNDDNRALGRTGLGRTSLYFFNQFTARFEPGSGIDNVRHLQPDPNELPFPMPMSAAVFALNKVSVAGVSAEKRTFVATANSAVYESDVLEGGARPTNLFLMTHEATDGIRTQVTRANELSEEQDLWLDNLQVQVDGGKNLAASLKRDFNMGASTRAYSASSATKLSVGGENFLVVGHSESFQTESQCRLHYATPRSDRCPHLEEPVANPSDCAFSCDTDGGPSEWVPRVRDTQTETVVYRLSVPNANLLARDELEPSWVEHQRLSSLSVGDVHSYSMPQTTAQAEYEGRNSTPNSGIARRLLAVSNSASSCETNLLANSTTLPKDPRTGVDIFTWSANRFEPLTQIKSECSIKMARPFNVKCHERAGLTPVPVCGAYLATVEDCSGAMMRNASWIVPYRVAFYRFDSATQDYRHCQPYPDPGDARNNVESFCRQSPDPLRTGGDAHYYDFPDLLPASLAVNRELTNDGSGLYTQLKGSNIASIDFSFARAQKDIFFAEDDEFNPIDDGDNEPHSMYYLNGRKQYELVLSIVYDARDSAPQIFGLEALSAKTSSCSSHVSSPVRREFTLVQQLEAVQGGKSVATFERAALDGTVKSYAVFPHYYSSGVAKGALTSIYVNSMCDEVTAASFSDVDRYKLSAGGIYGPTDGEAVVNVQFAQPEPYCPYSLDATHFEAWEAFMNHYNPVSPCKNIYASGAAKSVTIEQAYYNRMPAAFARSFYRGTRPPKGPYVHPRSTVVEIPTHGYAKADYEYLFATRDNVLTHAQDIDTYAATSVAVHEICGRGGQLWLFVGQDGWYRPLDESNRVIKGVKAVVDPPPMKSWFYSWNDHAAVTDATVRDGPRDGLCTRRAARLLVESMNDDIGSTQRPSRAALGCFEIKIRKLPINAGYTASVLAFEQNGLFFMQYVNRAATVALANRGFQASNQPVPDVNLCDASAPFGGVANLTGADAAVYALDTRVNGGTQCRAAEGDFNFELLNLERLSAHFVTVDSDQLITGNKRFQNNLTVFSAVSSKDLSVTGDGEFGGDVVADNMLALGTLNGEDVTKLGDDVRSLTDSMAALEARMTVAEDAPECTGKPGQCASVMASTRCYPRQQLSAWEYTLLQRAFSTYLKQIVPDLVLLAPRHASASNHATFVVVSSAGVADALASDLASLVFFDARYCNEEADVAEVPEGTVALRHNITFPSLDCAVMDVAAIRAVRIALATQLARYGVRAVDVAVDSITCGSTHLTLRVNVASFYQGPVDASLKSDSGLWSDFYIALSKAVPDSFVLEESMLDFGGDNDLVPLTETLSGDGSGDEESNQRGP